MDITLLKNFNNYFNRLIKRYENYIDYSYSFTHKSYPNLDFNPNDGVSTEQVINWTEDWTPDYLITHKQETTGTVITGRWFIQEWVRIRGKQYKATLRRDVVADFYGPISVSPCFIEKATLDSTSPLIFNKEGMVFNQIKKKEIPLYDRSGCPWIVGYIAKNYEGGEISASYKVDVNNSIDSGDLPWEFSPTSTAVGVLNNYSMHFTIGCYQKNRLGKIDDSWVEFTMHYNKNGLADSYDTKKHTIYDGGLIKFTNTANYTLYSPGGNDIGPGGVAKFILNNTDLALNKIPTSIANAVTTSTSTLSELLSYNNKIIHHGTKYYRLTVTQSEDAEQVFNSVNYPILDTNIDEFTEEYNPNHADLNRAAKVAEVVAHLNGVSITAVEVSNQSVTTTIPSDSNRTHLNDAPYDMFCMPYGAVDVMGYQTNGDVSMAVAQAMSAQIGSNLYDIQLLPYCPVQDVIKFNKLIKLDGLAQGYDYHLIEDSADNVLSFVIWCKDSKGTFDIQKHLEMERQGTVNRVEKTYVKCPFTGGMMKSTSYASDYDFELQFELIGNKVYNPSIFSRVTYKLDGVTYRVNTITSISIDEDNIVTIKFPGVGPHQLGTFYNITGTASLTGEFDEVEYEHSLSVDTKIENECNMYRLVSPNYNGQFEFNLARNNGSIDFFNVDFTYKPYQPYIHINFNFKGLYGKDFDDARGLILGGDFSLPVISDAWTNYQIQNKNYQNIFDRQIANMDFNNNLANQEAIWGTVAGSVSAGASGAVTGALVGGPMGAGIGAVVGGSASAIGGTLDMFNLKARQQENKAYTMDMYHYNLGNIQALPYSLTRTSSFTNNNKMVPIVEFYSCTDEEKEAFVNKITYDGMTVGMIDKIENYVSDEEVHYVKGQLIRLNNIEDDSHMTFTIYEEIAKGVYL